jgi:NADH dehydrogenase
MNVLVTGATGYVGNSVVRALVAAGHNVTAVSRGGAKSKTASGKDLGTVSGVNYVAGDVGTGAGLEAAFKGSVDAVIHLVGIIAERGDQTFQRVHVDGTRNVLNAAKAAGVKRYVHMSALGASATAVSRYSATKYQAEELVRASGLEWTIMRPSLIFGVGDDFFGRVLKNLVATPIVPQIGDGKFPFRPVWVGDVAQAFVQALTNPATIGQVYDLVGPKEYTFRQLLDLEMDVLGSRKPVVPAPIALMNLAVPAMQILGPLAPITMDQYAMLKAGNTADPTKMQQTFKLEGRALETELPRVLGKA